MKYLRVALIGIICCRLVRPRDRLFSLQSLLYAFLLLVLMAGRCDLQVDECQEGEDQSLHESDEGFKWDEDDVGNEGQNEGEDRQHRAARENVAKKTEGQRDDARQLDRKS